VNHQVDLALHEKVIGQIGREFSRFREEVGGRYSEALKLMVISAIDMGLSVGSVAEAAGVSDWTIRNWVGKVPKARELKLVAGPESQRQLQTSLALDLICIRLVSGVEIEFPRSELGVEFLRVLSSIGGSR